MYKGKIDPRVKFIYLLIYLLLIPFLLCETILYSVKCLFTTFSHFPNASLILRRIAV